MPSGCHAFHEIFLHFNWHCLGNQPLITAAIESHLHGFIEEYCRKLPAVHFKRIGGTETHVHLVVQVEPTVCPSEFIGKVKGASSHEMNPLAGERFLQWQRGYGVVSFARRNLPAVIRYVDRQREHHGEGTVNDVLEQMGTE